MKYVKLSTNQWITTIISVFALLFSARALYFEEHVDNSVVARVVDADLNWSQTKAPFTHDTAVISVAYSNLGNRQAVILTPWFQQSDTTVKSSKNIEEWMITNEYQFPFQMQPHESRLIKMKIPLSSLTWPAIKPHRDKFGDTTYKSYLSLRYIGLDSYLHSDSSYSNFDIEVIFTKKEIRDIKMSADPISPTNVFK